MEPISKASLFDTEILETTCRLENLIRVNAPFHELEAMQVKLPKLIDGICSGLSPLANLDREIERFLRFMCTFSRLAATYIYKTLSLLSISPFLDRPSLTRASF